jgi:general secretion pathway protein K
MTALPITPLNRQIRPCRLKFASAGFALVLVLWIISLLTIMAGSFALTMRRESTVVSIAKDNAAALAMAEAGVAVGQLMLLNPDQIKRWRADGNIYQVNFGDAKVRISLLAESGKFDINKVNPQQLEALLSNTGLDEDRRKKLIGAILDWRDPDDLLSLDGAEKKEYRDAGLKYGPRNKPFKTIEELQMVLGVDEQTYTLLEPMITVYSGQAQVNLKLATAKILKMLPNLDAELIDNFVISRLDSAKNAMPAPEFPTTAGGILNAANPNDAITVVSEAQMPDESSALVSVTIGKLENVFNQGSQFKTLKWQRNPANVPGLFTGQMDQLLVKEYAEPELSD